MRMIFSSSVLAVLLLATPSRCFAEMSIMQVTREKAKDLGIELRAKGNGPNQVWIELEFKPEGKLKDFSHVSLEIRDGPKLLVGYAALKEKDSSSGKVVVTFMADRNYLEKVTLSVVVGRPMDMSGYNLAVKDFVEWDKVH
jgi:hypothetical protein